MDAHLPPGGRARAERKETVASQLLVLFQPHLATLSLTEKWGGGGTNRNTVRQGERHVERHTDGEGHSGRKRGRQGQRMGDRLREAPLPPEMQEPGGREGGGGREPLTGTAGWVSKRTEGRRGRGKGDGLPLLQGALLAPSSHSWAPFCLLPPVWSLALACPLCWAARPLRRS